MLRGLGSVRGLGWINAKAAERAVIGDNTSKWKVRFTKEITELVIGIVTDNNRGSTSYTGGVYLERQNTEWIHLQTRKNDRHKTFHIQMATQLQWLNLTSTYVPMEVYDI